MPQTIPLKGPSVLAGQGVCPYEGRQGAEAVPAEGLRGGDRGRRLLGQALHLRAGAGAGHQVGSLLELEISCPCIGTGSADP